jgi:drug/metabolite transporter (DMT)-like permease
MQHTRRWFFDLILLSVACSWGLTFVLVQDAIVLLPPLTFLALRFGLAAFLLFIFARFTRQTDGRPISSRTLSRGIILGCILFVGYGLQTFSLLYTTSGKSGFLTGLSVTLVPLLAWLILRTRPNTASLCGVGIATIGLYLLAFVNFEQINPGDVLAFFCSIAFALQIIYTDKFSDRTSLTYLVVIQLATVACLSALAALIFEPWQHIFTSNLLLQPAVLVALLVTAVVATAFAFIAQTHIQRYSTPTRVALIFATEPIFAALADYVWNGHSLSPRGLLGCALILSGTLLTEIRLPWRKVIATR